MAKKTAIFKDTTTNAKITLIQNGDNSINLDVDNAKGLMRLISKQTGFQYDDEWNTQTLGSKLIDFINNPSDTITAKKTAVFKDNETNAKIILIQKDDNSIDFEVDNTKGLLRLIAKQVGFQYDADWNTQTLGSKLIDVINNPTETVVEGSLVADKADSTDKFFRWYEVYGSYDAYQAALEKDDSIDEDEMSGLSDGAWNWWKNLSDSMKLLLLRPIKWRSKIFEEDFAMPYLVDAKLYANSDEDPYEYDLNSDEMRGIIGFYLIDYIAELHFIDVSCCTVDAFFGGGSFCDGSMMYEFDDLAYLPKLEEMTFYQDDYLTFFPESLIKLKHLKRLDIDGTDVFYDTQSLDLENLFKFAEAHPQMEELKLDLSVFDNEKEIKGKLKALMPNCEIGKSN